MGTATDVQRLAEAELGYTNNGGTRYWDRVYSAWDGYAWCGAFCTDVTTRALGKPYAPGVKGGFYTPTIGAIAQGNGTWRPRESVASLAPFAALVLYNWQRDGRDTGKIDHVAFYAGGWDGRSGTFLDLGGNNRGGVSSNPIGVYRTRRHLADVAGFVDLSYLFTKPAPKPVAFPLGKDNFYGVNDNTLWSHSGIRGGDASWVKKIQAKVGVTADGIFGPLTAAAVRKWQSAHKIVPDAKVGPATFASFGFTK